MTTKTKMKTRRRRGGARDGTADRRGRDEDLGRTLALKQLVADDALAAAADAVARGGDPEAVSEMVGRVRQAREALARYEAEGGEDDHVVSALVWDLQDHAECELIGYVYAATGRLAPEPAAVVAGGWVVAVGPHPDYDECPPVVLTIAPAAAVRTL